MYLDRSQFGRPRPNRILYSSLPVKLYSFVFPWYLNVKGNITRDWYADLGVKPLIHQSERRTYTKVVRFKETISFRFVVFWKILNVMA